LTESIQDFDITVTTPVIIAARNNPKFNPDGSLDLYFSHVQPSTVPQANWLPAPSGDLS
jgi:hypothetical protein